MGPGLREGAGRVSCGIDSGLSFTLAPDPRHSLGATRFLRPSTLVTTRRAGFLQQRFTGSPAPHTPLESAGTLFTLLKPGPHTRRS